MELTPRKKEILKVVIENYIATAEPVGSKAIAQQLTSKVSTATIRNELADLVEMGYLEQPHTSAGRVPSPKGYRLYVNELMEQRALSLQETEEINQALQMKMQELDGVISKAGQMAAALVNYPAYAMAGVKSELAVQRFDLLPVDAQSFIAVVMTEDSRVKSRLLHTELPVRADALADLAVLLNEQFTHLHVSQMSRRLMDLAGQTAPGLFIVLNVAVNYAIEVLQGSEKNRAVTAGANNLLKLPEFRDADKAHELMSFMVENPEDLPVPAEGAHMQILIGPENVNEALKDTSVVVASYDIGDNMRGLIGVVGPTRMDYATVAARLSYFAEGLTKMFGKQEKEGLLPVPKEDHDRHE